MRASILAAQPLAGAVAQHVIADKFLDHNDLIIDRTGAAHDLAGLVVRIQRPEWHGGYPAASEISHVVLIQIGLQDVEWDARFPAGLQ